MRQTFIQWPPIQIGNNLPSDSALVALSDEGIKVKAIAKYYGFTPQTIGRRLEEARQRLDQAAQDLDRQAA